MNQIKLERIMMYSWIAMALIMVFFLMIVPTIIQFTKGNDLLFCIIITIILLIDLIPIFIFNKASKKLKIIKKEQSN